MISFYDGQLTDILPGNLSKEAEVQALSYALQQACRLLYRYSQRLYLYFNLDEQPEEVIDLLATELRTQHYRDTLDLDTKRQLVKNTLIWYMGAGTPESVEELVKTVFGEGKVIEWFEYGDSPYYFKIDVNTSPTPEMISYLEKMIWKVKNIRSHLRSVDIKRSTMQMVFTGAVSLIAYHPDAITEGYQVERKVGNTAYIGTATGSLYSRGEAVIDGFTRNGNIKGYEQPGIASVAINRWSVIKES